jgi:hypothetical protein
VWVIPDADNHVMVDQPLAFVAALGAAVLLAGVTAAPKPARKRPRRRSPPVPFPEFDPVLLQIGPFALRWYALAYIAGIASAGGGGAC